MNTNIDIEIVKKNVHPVDFDIIKQQLKVIKSTKILDVFSLIKRVGVIDICMILLDSDFVRTPLLLTKMYICENIDMPSGEKCYSEINFDCYLEYNQKRDYIIKKLVQLELANASDEEMLLVCNA